MALNVTSGPASEPVTTDEAKTQIRLYVANDDTYVASLIIAARIAVEEHIWRTLVNRTWEYVLDDFPRCNDAMIRVPRPPLVSVSSIQYVDTDGATQTLSASDYQVDAKSHPGRIVPAFNKVWPQTRAQLNTVTVTYIGGYGASIPETAKLAIKMMVAQWYERREPVVDGEVREVPWHIKMLLNQLWVGSLHRNE